MKIWNAPAVEELKVSLTSNVTCDYDSVDGNIYSSDNQVIGYTKGTRTGSGPISEIPDART